MASNKARIHFTLGGYHFNPDDVTRQIGLEPTRVDASGMGGALDKPALSFWELSTDTVTDDIDIYKMTDDLIKIIEPAKEKIIEIAKHLNLSPRIEIELTLSVDKGESVPELGVGARAMRFLSEIGAFVNIDYQLSERI